MLNIIKTYMEKIFVKGQGRRVAHVVAVKQHWINTEKMSFTATALAHLEEKQSCPFFQKQEKLSNETFRKQELSNK